MAGEKQRKNYLELRAKDITKFASPEDMVQAALDDWAEDESVESLRHAHKKRRGDKPPEEHEEKCDACEAGTCEAPEHASADDIPDVEE